MFKRLFCLMFSALLMTGCASRAEAPRHTQTPTATPDIAIPLPVGEDGLPVLEVFVLTEETIRPMDIETYLCGVVAGEMKNDWPMEALRAQAILARTFVLKFVTEKDSRYEGADVSTDITEAQAYNEESINDRVREAVRSTAGMVLVAEDGTLPYTWFHAHSGGKTALAAEGLNWQENEPGYTTVTEGLDSDAAPDDAREWSAVFSAKKFLAACRAAGAVTETAKKVTIKEKGDSGRAVTLSVDGIEVNAARLRLELGSTVMRSTLLTELSSDGKEVRMAGKGYGHGVGMPQWGAYALAQDGYLGEEIATYYYKDLSLTRLWNEP